MKKIAGVRWRANRNTLTKYYITTIRAKLMYGSTIYGSAAPSTLARLDIIQNAALSISLGA